MATMVSSAGALLAILNEDHRALKLHTLSNLNAFARDFYQHSSHLVVPPLNKRACPEGKLIKTSVNAALNDLKEKYDGYLLSAHALKRL